MKLTLVTLSLFIIVLTGCAQSSGTATTKQVGGPCEGCEAIFETPVPFLKLPPVDTMPDFYDQGPKLEISGTVYKIDGTTPTSDVVVYAYHTDQTGRYPTKGNETGWGKRHGYIRGWVKTKNDGRYKFLTNKPAAYPGRTDPAHIHLIVKEPDKNEYWIDDIEFGDDPLLTADKRKKQPHGGNGIVTLKTRNGMWYAERDIYLGMNIPRYGK